MEANPPGAAVAASLSRIHTLWFAFLAVWAAALLHYGAVAPLAVAAVAAAMALLNALAIVALPGPFVLSRPAQIFLAAVAALFSLQLVPGLGFLFPWTSALRESHGAAGRGPGTADAFLTVRQGAQVAAYALAALFTLRLIQAGLARAFAVRSVVGVLALEALYAVAQTGFRFETIPFFGKRLELECATGTLVNRNSFAGLMAMGVALAVGVAWGCFASKRRERGRVFESGLLWTVAAALFAAAAVLSRSRGGALAAVAGLAALPFFMRRRSRATAAAGLGLLVAAGALTVMAANTEPLLERFQSIEGRNLARDTRVVCWQATLAGAKRQPVFGFGIGAYPRAFHAFQPPALPGQFQHAHSEVVTAAFEGGAAWLALLVGGLAVWFVRSARGLGSLEGRERVAAGAAMAGVVACALHGLVDFDLRVTGVGLLFAILLGIVPAWSSEAKRAAPAVLAAAVLALAAAATLAFAPLDPEGRGRAAGALDPAAAEVALHKILTVSPCDPAAAWHLARAAERRGDLDLAAKRFETAAALWPSNPATQVEAGVWLWGEGKRGPAAVCLRRAFEGDAASVAEALDRIWSAEEPVATWEDLASAPAGASQLAAFLAREGRWQEAAEVFGRRVPATRENAKEFDGLAKAFDDAGQWGLEAATLEARLAVSSDAPAHRAAARAWAKLEAWDKALENARYAARLDPANAEGPALAAEVLEGKGDHMAAAEEWTKAIALAPRAPEMLRRRAKVFAKQGLSVEAAADERAAAEIEGK